MRKLGTLTDWRQVPETGIHYEVDEPRKVRIEAIGDNAASLTVTLDEGGECFLLGEFFGAETFEFAVDGAFTLNALGGEVAVYTVDGDDVTVPAVAPESFTRIAERRARNPELEYIEYVAKQNQLRLEAALREEREQARRDRDEHRALLERLAATGANDTASSPAPASAGVRSEPKQAGSSGEAIAAEAGNGGASGSAS